MHQIGGFRPVSPSRSSEIGTITLNVAYFCMGAPKALEAPRRQSWYFGPSGATRTRWFQTVGVKPRGAGEAGTGQGGFSGGDDRTRGKRTAGATRAAAAGAPRSRRGDRGAADRARRRYPANPAPQEAQAGAARPHYLHRGPADPRYHRLTACFSRV